jgi:hypothetical protein
VPVWYQGIWDIHTKTAQCTANISLHWVWSISSGAATGNCRMASKNFFDYLNTGRFSLCGTGNVFEEAHLLMELDQELQPTDALILASAIGCESCDTLYTTDRVLLKSTKLREHAKKKELKVLELPDH